MFKGTGNLAQLCFIFLVTLQRCTVFVSFDLFAVAFVRFIRLLSVDCSLTLTENADLQSSAELKFHLTANVTVFPSSRENRCAFHENTLRLIFTQKHIRFSCSQCRAQKIAHPLSISSSNHYVCRQYTVCNIEPSVFHDKHVERDNRSLS